MAKKTKKEAKEWLAAMEPRKFEALWAYFCGQSDAQKGWVQVEITERFPEFVQWARGLPENLTMETVPEPKPAAPARPGPRDGKTVHEADPDWQPPRY